MDDLTPCDGTILRILLADDHAAFRHSVRNLLRKVRGCELVGEAANGQEVVRLAGEMQPDIVIMDVVMPRLSGIEATRRIKRAFPAIEIIALSIHADAGFRRAMLDAGASTYLLKDGVGDELPMLLRSIADRVAQLPR